MCFTPTISLSTAIFEFLVATFLLFYYKQSRFRVITIFIYLLGLYQFTEFMLCISGNSLWAKIGFITYTFLPAVALKFCLDYVNKKSQSILVFAPPFLFSLFALFEPNFITNSSCETYFVTVKHLFYNPANTLLATFYLTYYLGFIAFTSYLLVKHYKNAKNKFYKKIDITVLLGIFVSLVPAILLLFIFPSLSMQFPSIYCQFAIVFTISAIIAFNLENTN